MKKKNIVTVHLNSGKVLISQTKTIPPFFKFYEKKSIFKALFSERKLCRINILSLLCFHGICLNQFIDMNISSVGCQCHHQQIWQEQEQDCSYIQKSQQQESWTW